MSAVDWSEGTPVHDVRLPAREDALRRWLLPPTNAWAGYAKYTLLTSLGERSVVAELPDVEALDAVYRARAAGRRVAGAGLPADTLWIVDMRGAASIAFGVGLSSAPPSGAPPSVSLVPTFNNWPAENELVPAEETLAALVTMSPSAPVDGVDGGMPVFLLDAWRMAYRSDETSDDTYDNRYMLSPGDLPDVATLRAHGIRRVLYVVENLDDTSIEEDDVHSMFLEYKTQGLDLAMVDLEVMSSASVATVWDDLFARWALVVEPRVTLVDEPSFYVRARGGFGGILARPFAGGWGHGGHYGMHGGGG